MAQRGNRDLRFVARLLHVELDRGVVNRGVTRRRSPFEILHHVAVGILQRLRQRHGDGLAIDLECDLLVVIGPRRRIQPNELSVNVATEKALVVVPNEKALRPFRDYRHGLPPFDELAGLESERCRAISCPK